MSYHSREISWVLLRMVAAGVMIYGEDFTQLSETAQVEMKSVIDCDNLMERKDLKKVVYTKRGM